MKITIPYEHKTTPLERDYFKSRLCDVQFHIQAIYAEIFTFHSSFFHSYTIHFIKMLKFVHREICEK